ncbi:MAG: hypothetical protein HY822_17155 [Acidobacteria bacterium]|nr:hypothetical protein [Acidobacteriota bacterium]
MRSTSAIVILAWILAGFATPHADAQSALLKLVAPRFFDAMFSVGTSLLTDSIRGSGNKGAVSAAEVESLRRKTAELERQLEAVKSDREYSSRREFLALQQAVGDMRRDQDALSRSRGAGLEEFQARLPQRVQALTASLQGFQNSFQGQAGESVSIVIHNRLRPDQWVENADLYLSGRYAGKLLVNAYYPQSAIRVNFDREGSCPYRVDAQAMFFDPYGQFFTAQTSGAGVIRVFDGANFALSDFPNGTVGLVPMQ